MAQQTLFVAETPGLPNINEGAPVTVATTVVFAVDGTLDGFQVYPPATVSGTFSGAAWEVTADDSPADSGTGTLIATAAMPSLTPSTWQTVALGAPVAVTAGTAYRIGLRSSEGRYAATGGGFNAAGMTNGDITAPQTGTSVGIGVIANGTFIESVTLYPNKTFNGNKYFIGPVFSPAEEPAEGVSALFIELDGAVTGGAAHQGVSALALNLDGAVTGSSPNSGVSALALNLDGAVSGAAAHGGVSGLALNLDGAVSGARSSLGASALALNLDGAATGARASSGTVSGHINLDGSVSGPGSGCSVLPIFPWACVSVPSFSEVRS